MQSCPPLRANSSLAACLPVLTPAQSLTLVLTWRHVRSELSALAGLEGTPLCENLAVYRDCIATLEVGQLRDAGERQLQEREDDLVACAPVHLLEVQRRSVRLIRGKPSSAPPPAPPTSLFARPNDLT